MDNKEKGNIGEATAVLYLKNNGYEIIKTNYRIRNAEIDIIAKKDSIIAFIEVKLRRNRLMGEPLEAVDLKKQKKIILAANAYIGENDFLDCDFRFDVIEVFGVNTYKINHIENAFWA